jgi:heme/copper-type cytochrome/quinol oxidase subunit 2
LRSSIRWPVIVASVIAVVVLFVILRPDDGDDSIGVGTRTTSPTPSTPGSPSPTGSPEPRGTVVEVTFRDGAVQGPTRFTLTQGEDVRILVRADVTDEVHLHGYDLRADVAPGDPARIDFVADVAGVFECELEDAGTLLFQLEIVP